MYNVIDVTFEIDVPDSWSIPWDLSQHLEDAVIQIHVIAPQALEYVTLEILPIHMHYTQEMQESQ